MEKTPCLCLVFFSRCPCVCLSLPFSFFCLAIDEPILSCVVHVNQVSMSMKRKDSPEGLSCIVCLHEKGRASKRKRWIDQKGWCGTFDVPPRLRGGATVEQERIWICGDCHRNCKGKGGGEVAGGCVCVCGGGCSLFAFASPQCCSRKGGVHSALFFYNGVYPP